MKSGVDTDTIVALATVPGRGGVGVVRLSGPNALVIAQGICGKAQPLEPRLATLSTFKNQKGETLDQGLCLCFPGPASFTGENVAELQGHGSPIVLDRIIQAATAAGARLARPGEFSERAYLNGKMDLAQAEAVADLINAASTESARAAMRSLQGEFSSLLDALSGNLLKLRVQVEAAIDFPDEDIELLSAPGVTEALDGLVDAVEHIVERTQTGVRLTEGARIVLIGAPNVGKSSVLNRLCGEDRAIVTPVAGTTRDLVREQLLLQGIPVELVDTAGVRKTTDIVEAEGVRRAEAAALTADLVLAVYDASDPQTLDFLTQWLTRQWGDFFIPTKTERSVHSLAELDELDASRPNSLVPVGRLPALVIVGNKLDRVTSIANDDMSHSGHHLECKLALTNDLVPINDLLRTNDIENACVSAKTGEGIKELTERLVAILGGSKHRHNVDSFSARSRHLQALQRSYTCLVDAQQGISTQLGAELIAEHLRHAQAELGSVCGEITTDELLGEIFSGFCIGK